MAGIAGQMIGIAATPQIPIGGLTRVNADSGTTGRGCNTNFIGFGLNTTNTESGNPSFATPEDDAYRAHSGASAKYVPTYTGKVLAWVLTA